MMKFSLQNLAGKRTGLVVLLVLIVVSISLLTRIALLVKSFSAVDLSVVNLIGIFGLGLLYDLVNAAYVGIPLVIYLWLVPSKVYAKPWHRFVLYGIFSIVTFLLLFNAVSEWFFWDEFSTRFNFIAVDYLVYTTEVIGNIQQSYPIGSIVTAIGCISLLFIYSVKSQIKRSSVDPLRFRRRTKLVGIYGGILLLIAPALTSKQHRFSDNTYANELSGNGLYELFAAYRTNELDYDQFYKRIESKKAFNLVHQLIKTPEAEFIKSNAESIERRIVSTGREMELNVVLISYLCTICY